MQLTCAAHSQIVQCAYGLLRGCVCGAVFLNRIQSSGVIKETSASAAHCALVHLSGICNRLDGHLCITMTAVKKNDYIWSIAEQL